MSGIKPISNGLDKDWHDNKITRKCECGEVLLRSDYINHLKDGRHNEKMTKPKGACAGE